MLRCILDFVGGFSFFSEFVPFDILIVGMRCLIM